VALRTYRFGDAFIRTEFSLQTLPEVPDARVGEALRVSVGPPAPARRVRAWRHRWQHEGRTAIALAKLGPHYLLRFPRACDFLLDGNGRDIAVQPRPGLDPGVLEHLLVDQVLPRVLSGLGRFALHASSVEVDGALVLFVGDSGRGKSTTAALFAQRGHRLHSDDCVLLAEAAGEVRGIATYASLRLLADSVSGVYADGAPARIGAYSGKSRLSVQPARARPAERVAAIFLLGSPLAGGGPAIATAAVAPALACIELMKNCLQLDPRDFDLAATQLREVGRIAACVPVHRLACVHDFSRSAETVDALLAFLAGDASRPPRRTDTLEPLRVRT
jgi:hypothetical protein